MRLVLIALTVLAGCAADGTDYPADTSMVLVDETCPGEPANVGAVSYAGTDMSVTATYGGCQATRIWACFDGRYAISDPPMAEIHINHEPAGDCDALLASSLTFSLSPMVDDAGVLGDVQRIILFVGENGASTRVDWQR
jgi:hypothetical protein